MKVLELFAGTRSIGKAFEAAGHEVFSVEWDKKHSGIHLYADIGELTAQDILEAVQKAADILAKDALDSLLLEKSREEIPELLEGIQKVAAAAKKSAKDSIELYSKDTLREGEVADIGRT